MLCTFDTTFILQEPPLLLVDTSSTPSNLGAPNGTATVIPSGGTPPYQYFWGTGDTTQTITGLLPGWYNFVVTDANYCETIGGVMVGTFTGVLEHDNVLGFVAYPNPTNGLVNLDIQLTMPMDVELVIYDALGEMIWQENKKLASHANWPIGLQQFPAGIYQVLLKSGTSLLVTERILKY